MRILILLSVGFLAIYVSPTNQNRNFVSSSDFAPLISTRGLLQDEAVSKIEDNTLARIEEQLAKSRGKIRKAIVEKSFVSNETNGSFITERTIYKNPFAFFQSHNEMMKTFKIWTYEEGDIPLVHDGPMKCIYSIEGDFIQFMERKGNQMAASHPDEAHAFFIPISITNIVHYLYTPSSNAFAFIDQQMEAIVEDYINIISHKYPYWNRSNGADHFFVSCHDWAPFVTRGNAKMFENFIRVLCNANTSEGFVPNRDVSMTEINGPADNIPIVSSGQSPYNRSILAFFAGGNHGYVRKKLFQYWGSKQDKDIQVYNHLPKDQNYTKLMGQSMFCLCPSGYEIASARATEAIYVGCIPVMIKSHYALPYGDVLDWSRFSVQVPVDNIQDLKRILQEMPFIKYLEMQNKVMEVQKHFMVNIPAKKFDVIHMILHSVWLRRLNVKLNPFNLS
ncbi:probable glycosyltransferase At3g42180 [Rutidosis leptorrhynchoides]|uniref:probable glycosyltransferase At3g42180 n=1 Tax=Rutidosis leptorrhynchoides TaxID=125765 RepID=UPI003A99EE8B